MVSSKVRNNYLKKILNYISSKIESKHRFKIVGFSDKSYITSLQSTHCVIPM